MNTLYQQYSIELSTILILMKIITFKGNSKVFEAIDSPEGASKFLDDYTTVEKSILLKEGTQVMLLKNINVSLGLVNGARGVVEKFVNGMILCNNYLLFLILV